MATRDEGDEHDESMGEREARAWAASLTWAASLRMGEREPADAGETARHYSK